MPRADAVTPEPVYASPTVSSIAWTVPSSPNGPWRAMNTSGWGRSAAIRSIASPAGSGPSAPSADGSS